MSEDDAELGKDIADETNSEGAEVNGIVRPCSVEASSSGRRGRGDAPSRARSIGSRGRTSRRTKKSKRSKSDGGVSNGGRSETVSQRQVEQMSTSSGRLKVQQIIRDGVVGFCPSYVPVKIIKLRLKVFGQGERCRPCNFCQESSASVDPVVVESFLLWAHLEDDLAPISARPWLYP